jgi:hypothetical protein
LQSIGFSCPTQARAIRAALKATGLTDTGSWRSVCAVTLTLKQALPTAKGTLVAAREFDCHCTLEQFVYRLNRACYGNAARRGKRLRVIAVVEKAADGRWHIHAAIESPNKMNARYFEKKIRSSWSKPVWAHREIEIRHDANQGYVEYMLKLRQKSGYECWFDSIDLGTLHNPIAEQ